MNLKRKMANGAAWLMGVRLLNRGVGFISTIILARLLVPEDFGLVAMAMVVVGMFELINAYTLQIFLVQKQDLSDQDLNSAWTLQVIFNTIQAVFLVAVSLPVAKLYGEPRLVHIFWALGGTLFLSGFKNIGIMYFQRDLLFHKEFILMGFRKLTAFSVTVILAFFFRSHWALISGIIAGRLTVICLSYLLHPYRPRFCLTVWKELYRFSRWLYINNFLYFMRNKGQEFFVGKIAGPGPLGIFTVSYDIAMMPTTEMVAPINRAVFPGYARMKDNPEQLKDGYLTVLAMIALVALPVAVGMSATADILIPILLGENWLGAIPVVQILAVSGAINSLQTNNGSVYISLGKPWISTCMNTISVILLVPLMITGTLVWNVTGAAWAYFISTGIMLPVSLGVIMHMLKIQFTEILSSTYRPMAGALIMFCGVRFILYQLEKYYTDISTVHVAVLLVFSGAGLYFLGIVFFWILAGKPKSAEINFLILISEKTGLPIPGFFQAKPKKATGTNM